MVKIARSILLFVLLLFQVRLHAMAEWSFLFYIQADNNLTEYADGKLSSIVKAYQSVAFNADNLVNALVQIDFPQDKKTWRFKIDRRGKVDAGSLDEEMGVDPAGELVKSVAWMVAAYPAKKYGVVLMNHGSGTEDYRGIPMGRLNYNQFWVEIGKGLDSSKYKETLKKFNSKDKQTNKKLNASALEGVFVDKRGILYDDSDRTCLSNQGLTAALTQIRDNILGRTLDFIGMDACLMAMTEVAYQMKGLVEVFVGSQDVELAPGWPYDKFLIPLLNNPSFYGPIELGALAVKAYGERRCRRCTQSAINMNMIGVLRDNINAVATTLLECIKYKSSSVRAALRTARANSFEFEFENYIDLYTFYAALHVEVAKLRQEAENETPTCCGLFKTSANYIPALDHLTQYLIDGMALVGQVVFANVVSSETANAHGISICFPKKLIKINGTYPKTLFVQDVPNWYALIKRI